jgi:hypothetical protein
MSQINVPDRNPQSIEDRLQSFDQATLRQREREGKRDQTATSNVDRGWTREDIYEGRCP